MSMRNDSMYEAVDGTDTGLDTGSEFVESRFTAGTVSRKSSKGKHKGSKLMSKSTNTKSKAANSILPKSAKVLSRVKTVASKPAKKTAKAITKTAATRTRTNRTSTKTPTLHGRMQAGKDSTILCQRRSQSNIWQNELQSVGPQKYDAITCGRCKIALKAINRQERLQAKKQQAGGRTINKTNKTTSRGVRKIQKPGLGSGTGKGGTGKGRGK